MNDAYRRTAQDPDYGLGKHAFDSDKLGLIDEESLTERLIAVFSAPNYEPPRLPAVATELLAQSQNPNVEFGDIEKLLERDAMLAGAVLAIARSAFYSRQRPPETLKDALVLIGLTKLREIVMQAALSLRVSRSKVYSAHMQRLGEHSLATAHVARMVSKHTPIDEEQAFLCGLLHDVGLAGILLALGNPPRGEEAPDLTVLWPAIHRAHPGAGARIIELWKLPENLSRAVSAHHQVRIGGDDNPLAATVCIAEDLVTACGHGFMPPSTAAVDDVAGLCESALTGSIDRTDGTVIRRAAEGLEISEATLADLRAQAQEWIAQAHTVSV